MALGSKGNEENSSSTWRHRLVNSLSSSYPGSILTNAFNTSNNVNKDDDPLSKSCFAQLSLDKIKLQSLETDDELTNLNWLNNNDLLKNLDTGDRSLCTSPIDDQKENGDYYHPYSRQHPPHIPYNPLKHTNSKPPYSFSCLIFMSIEDSVHKKLPVKDIYNWILTHFPYFQNAPTGWKNSVRHNLSLNKCFMKVDKERGQSIGKGSLWCIDPDYRPNLLQALRKTPYHPYHQLQMLANPSPTINYTLLPKLPGGVNMPLKKENFNTPSPELFPFLSRRMALSKSDTASDIDVANTLVSLKGLSSLKRRGRKLSGDEGHASSRSPSPPEFGSERDRQQLKLNKIRGHRSSSPIVVTPNPSLDHTYTMTSVPPCSPGSSIDGEYEFEEKDLLDSPKKVNSPPVGRKPPMIVKLPGFVPQPIKQEIDDEECDSELSDMEEELLLREQHRIAREHYRREMRARAVKARLRPGNVDEEELRIVEGAESLLNLAGISTGMPLKGNAKSGAKRTAKPPGKKNKRLKTDITNNNNIEKMTSSQPTTADMLASVDKGLPLIQKIKEEKEDDGYDAAATGQHDVDLEICFEIKQEPKYVDEDCDVPPEIVSDADSEEHKIQTRGRRKKKRGRKPKRITKKVIDHKKSMPSAQKNEKASTAEARAERTASRRDQVGTSTHSDVNTTRTATGQITREAAGSSDSPEDGDATTLTDEWRSDEDSIQKNSEK